MPPTQRLLYGDAREIMAHTKPEVYSAIVTDPPYGLGFMGKDWDKPRPGEDFVEYFHGGDFQRWTFLWARQALRVLKPGGYMLAMAGTRLWHRTACGIEDAGFEIRDTLMWLYGTGFPKSLDVSKAIDKAAGKEREVVGKNRNARKASGNIAICKKDGTGTITAPATDAARQWEGWGTALKPAWEPIILCRKPLTGTVAANVQEHGAGALNVGGCRIGMMSAAEVARSGQSTQADGWGMKPRSWKAAMHKPAGRWPANVALDEQAAAMLDAQSGERGGGGSAPKFNRDKARTAVSVRAHNPRNPNLTDSLSIYGDSGGASRFFYCAKASRKERGEGNDHPTVKPIALMRWLITLVTPPNGIILDPFVGSGTTLIAASELGIRGVGIDFDEHAIAVARSRLGENCLT